MADERLEEVVEVVGDPTGEPPDRLHLLGLGELLLKFQLGGDVALDRHVVDDRAILVTDWRDRHLLLVQRAVLAPVGQPPRPDGAVGDRGPHLRVEPRILLATLENSRVQTDDLVGPIPCDPLERGIHVQDDPAAIRDDDRFARLLDGCDEPLAFLLTLLPLRDVAGGAENGDVPSVVDGG